MLELIRSPARSSSLPSLSSSGVECGMVARVVLV